MASVFDDLEVGAVKTGMLGTAGIIMAVAARIAAFPGPAVVDPVMVATSGDMLIQEDAVAVLKRDLIPAAALITPNLDEAAVLSEMTRAETIDDMAAQGHALIAGGARAVLMKGGHIAGGRADDLLVTGHGAVLIAGERVETGNTHGTGCTLSAAIAVYLASGEELEGAVRRGKAYLEAALRAADRLNVGRGHGPVDHLFALDSPRVG
jgi:hydroxymethylpyrimidine/phosphomethylpyrimidine kinase